MDCVSVIEYCVITYTKVVHMTKVRCQLSDVKCQKNAESI